MVQTKAKRRMIAGYDRAMSIPLITRYNGGSDFWNYGYWRPETRSQQEASENLMEELMSFVPEKQGRILDVACGMGATTRYLLKWYRPADVTGINLSEVQLAKGRENAPGCTFLLMDAVKLDFPDDSVENIICVEAAFHFDTRDQFYAEALRVLKPGGRLVTSDILSPNWIQKAIPANFVPDPPALGERLRSTGFQDVCVEDAKEQCWQGVCRHIRRWPSQERRAGDLSVHQHLLFSLGGLAFRVVGALAVKHYVLTSAQKPPNT